MTVADQVSNKKLLQFIEEIAALCTPDQIHVVNGSEEENQRLCDELVEAGVFTPVTKRPGSYLARSDPRDVARSEAATFICSNKKEDAGPTNNWYDPAAMKKRLHALFNKSMKGRTMYVIPFCMGPLGSSLARIGVEITDSAYVVVNMRIMAKIGDEVLKQLGDGDFVRCVHSVGWPLEAGQEDVLWPCNIENRHITHFPETKEIWSFGSGYGGNALLGKKCLALRIASVMAREEGISLAEHMLILGLTSPEGKKYYVAAAFPSACGKTNLAMLRPTLPGWKVETVGDDIAWMKLGEDGRMYAVNPENGFFGVAPGTSFDSNPNAMLSIEKNTIFTNVALTEDGDVWWEGLTKEPPSGKIITWLGKTWSKESGEPKPQLAHPNSRFTAPIDQCPCLDPASFDPKGVPIDAIIFGGRRMTTVPLVYESFNWAHGVMVGSAVASEQTAAAEGKVGALRFDPFAMLPFCGYDMADCWEHWLEIGKMVPEGNLPKIFNVNWFRKEGGKFLWPGFGENSRVLKWIVERTEGKDIAIPSPIGYIPKPGTLDLEGLNVDQATIDKLLNVDPEAYLDEVKKIREHHAKFGSHLPKGLINELDALEGRLVDALAN